MAIEPKTTREHILSLYGHVSGVKKNIAHMHKGIHELGGKIDKIYWVLLAAVGTVALLLLERFIT
ncbi:hypothetical protein N9S62_02475 [Pelagibacteraceae bacterium]|jgi:hypothetical protein|nr:hypothetical protein [Pelagibacteraceae bacterium]|tara:strand:- start:707 stop:901 length:195 start_codon:yes stop_codon:yes gene_type:complete